LQDYLSGLYCAEPGYRVTDFLVTDPALASVLGGAALIPNTEETVFVSESDESLDLCLYLDRELLARLEDENPIEQLRASRIRDVWTVLEGISHFNYLVWSARQDRKVTLMELEIQAEVDKFVSTWMLAQRQTGCDFAHLLHGWLFEEISFNPALDSSQRERYQLANSYAGRFCHGLRRRLHGDSEPVLRELRRFYRLTQTEKISHIHSQAYAGSA
ncbi:MAG: hypothetical protein ACREQZ_14255, partial [Woeseiaceae bacterium]